MHRRIHSSQRDVLFAPFKLYTPHLFWIIFPCFLFTVSDACPFYCECFSASATVWCSSPNLTDVPEEIPVWVQNLTISGSNITVLGIRAFTRNGSKLYNLSFLSLTGNNIEKINSLAFDGLPNVSHLDLSRNMLQNISDDAFLGFQRLQVLNLSESLESLGDSGETQLSNALCIKSLSTTLKRLDLSKNKLKNFPNKITEKMNLEYLNFRGNALQYINGDSLAEWYSQNKLKVYLSDNPFLCNCSLIPLFLWIKNSSLVPDAQTLICSGPKSWNATFINKLQLDDIKCKNEDLETVSYVFLGIVLALIGVVFLMVLYLNRKGIKRWMNNLRDACRDQMEGYHYRYEQDSDPRRSTATISV
ncbi:trophoblast glycoprotein-like [Protopterus annectens]|uniref:trophoblast glycoprotein-like n=1 Tax=Protopterus annectens TaxID=7888 RepID=UPI001CF9CDB4|nr:trophoblast glycoprotein-like [Protopterus annectens]